MNACKRLAHLLEGGVGSKLGVRKLLDDKRFEEANVVPKRLDLAVWNRRSAGAVALLKLVLFVAVIVIVIIVVIVSTAPIAGKRLFGMG